MIIFSVDKIGNKLNLLSQAIAENYLNGMQISYQLAVGSYKGTEEVAFIVGREHQQKVLDITKRFEQESILIVEDDKSTKFVYLDGKVEKSGNFIEIDSTKDIEGWTKIGDKIFTIK